MKRKSYVYGIFVDGTARYIGKGTGSRVHFHMDEVRRINERRRLGANTDATCTKFYRKLAEAVRNGAVVRQRILIGQLADGDAYEVEKQRIDKIYIKDPEQLWNTIDVRFAGTTWKAYKAGWRRS